MQGAPTSVRPERARTSATAAEVLAAAGSLLVGVSAALPWMAAPAGSEGDDAHAFHGGGFLVLIVALLTGLSALNRLRAARQGAELPAARPAVGRAVALLGAAAAEVAAAVWFAHTYRADGDVVRGAVSGWYLALAGAAVTMLSGLVCLAGSGRSGGWPGAGQGDDGYDQGNGGTWQSR